MGVMDKGIKRQLRYVTFVLYSLLHYTKRIDANVNPHDRVPKASQADPDEL